VSSPTPLTTDHAREQGCAPAVPPDRGERPCSRPFSSRFTRRCPTHHLDLDETGFEVACPAGHRPRWWQVWDHQTQTIVALGGGFKDTLLAWKRERRPPRHRVGRPKQRRAA
jgi:hypothetical protein